MPLPAPLYLEAGLSETRSVGTGQGRIPLTARYRIGGAEREVPVALFWKDVLVPGDYRHPVTGQRLSVTPDRIAALARNVREMIAAGEEIPTPLDHSNRAEDNIGWVVDAKAEGGRLSLLHAAVGDSAAEIALRNRASVCIVPDYVDGKGRHWGEAIVHSAYTSKPVIGGMDGFRPAFAASSYLPPGQTGVAVYRLSQTPEEPDMNLSPETQALIRHRLALAPDVAITDAHIQAALWGGAPPSASDPRPAPHPAPNPPQPAPAPAPAPNPPQPVPQPAPQPQPPAPQPAPGTPQPAPGTPVPVSAPQPLPFAASAAPAGATIEQELAGAVSRLYEQCRESALARRVTPAQVQALDAIFRPEGRLTPVALSRTADGRYGFEHSFAALAVAPQSFIPPQSDTFAASAVAAAGGAPYARTVPGNVNDGSEELRALDEQRRAARKRG